MNKKLVLATGILWLGGLAAAIIGMNIDSEAGKWLTIGGNGAFLIGLALAGVVWALKSKEQNQQAGNQPADKEPSEPEGKTDSAE